jgi:hypothetical protein
MDLNSIIVLGELMKHQTNRGEQPHLYFVRDKYGEVDCVLETSTGLALAEVKATSTYTKEHGAKLAYFGKLFDIPTERRYIIYSGETQSRSDIQLVNITDLEAIVGGP